MKVTLYIALMLIAYNLVGSLSNDIFVPTLPFLVDILNTKESLVKLTFSIWFIGAAIGQISSAFVFSLYNKERSFLLSGILFCVATYICIEPYNINQLMVGRFLQGLSFSACNVFLFTEIQANFTTKDQLKLFTLNNVLGVLSPLVGPILGTYIMTHYSWDYNFYLIFLSAFVLFFIYTILTSTKIFAVKKIDKSKELEVLYHAYLSIITDFKQLAITSGPGMIISSVACYILLAPFIMLQEFKITHNEFGYYQAVIMSSYIAGMVIARFYRPNNLVLLANIGCLILMLSGSTIALSRILEINLKYVYIISIMLGLIGLGYILNSLIVSAMNKIEHKTVGASIIWVCSSIACTLYTVGMSAMNCDKLLLLGIVFILNAVLINLICRLQSN